jgi:hypothetical protein
LRRGGSSQVVAVGQGFWNGFKEKRGSGSEIKREVLSRLAVVDFDVRLKKLAERLMKTLRSATHSLPACPNVERVCELHSEQRARSMEPWNVMTTPPLIARFWT